MRNKLLTTLGVAVVLGASLVVTNQVGAFSLKDLKGLGEIPDMETFIPELKMKLPGKMKPDSDFKGAFKEKIKEFKSLGKLKEEMGEEFSMISLDEGESGFGTFTTADLDAPIPEGMTSHLHPGNMFGFKFEKKEKEWKIEMPDSFEDSMEIYRDETEEVPDLQELLKKPQLDWEVPAFNLMSSAVNSSVVLASQSYNNYKLPWQAGQGWQVTQGWHPDNWQYGFAPYYSIDFDIAWPQTNGDILAMASGTIVATCTGAADQYFFSIQTDGTNEKLGYLHLDGASVRSLGLGQGDHVVQGQKLGKMRYADSGIVRDSCGTSNGTHLHMYFPSKPFTADGVTFSSSNAHLYEILYSTNQANYGIDYGCGLEHVLLTNNTYSGYVVHPFTCSAGSTLDAYNSTVENDHWVEFVAGDRIKLGEGFRVKSSAQKFRAWIGDYYTY